MPLTQISMRVFRNMPNGEREYPLMPPELLDDIQWNEQQQDRDTFYTSIALHLHARLANSACQSWRLIVIIANDREVALLLNHLGMAVAPRSSNDQPIA